MSDELTIAVTHPDVDGIIICQWLTGSIYEWTLTDGRTVTHDSATGLTIVRAAQYERLVG